MDFSESSAGNSTPRRAMPPANDKPQYLSDQYPQQFDSAATDYSSRPAGRRNRGLDEDTFGMRGIVEPNHDISDIFYDDEYLEDVPPREASGLESTQLMDSSPWAPQTAALQSRPRQQRSARAGARSAALTQTALDTQPESYVDAHPDDESNAPSGAKRLIGGSDKRFKLSSVQYVAAFCIAISLALFAWMGWEYLGTNVTSNQAISNTKKELKQTWADPASTVAPRPVPGDAIALLRIPRLGDDYEYPIIAGVESEQLAKGIGWYTSTAQPGQVGNFAVAGHRITHGEPFAKLLQLQVGDKVIVETRKQIFTYEITTAPKDLTVGDKDGSWVLWPVPDKNNPGTKPTQATMTLTTCTDLFFSDRRSVAFSKLVSTANK